MDSGSKNNYMKTHLKTILIILCIIIAVNTIIFLLLIYKMFAIITLNLLIAVAFGLLYYVIYNEIKNK